MVGISSTGTYYLYYVAVFIPQGVLGHFFANFSAKLSNLITKIKVLQSHQYSITHMLGPVGAGTGIISTQIIACLRVVDDLISMIPNIHI